ncbi:hypothetical protein B9Z47_09585 [Limnohabitans sp. 2KL-1]|uniref:TolC family protein n=1 Tax=Limnohabitans sp. 2KL-1 TaxID=1100699 RepID=UPI000D33A153|nr:TolC family protein [Limnohabitans sp. 2KL-1]PUE48075.1 hypothetical protein B9Z47_09585 [Limnohabitans sp. 2KL-1]
MKNSIKSMVRTAATTAVACAALAAAPQAMARDLVSDYESALTFDPTYQGALAEFEVGSRSVKQARAVFFPEANFSTLRLATDTGSRTTLTISQPLLDMERLMALRQATPRQLQAEVGLLTRKQDLALRLVKASNTITLALENLALNEARMDALNQQALRARRLLDAGQGTITDLRDIEVRANQGQAQQLTLQTQLHNALQQYQAITGVLPPASDFALPAKHGSMAPSVPPNPADTALSASLSARSARYGLEIAEYEVKKIKASFLPTVSGVYSRSQSGDVTSTNQYVGLGFSVPLKAGSVYGLEAAVAGVTRAQQAVREAESKVRLESDRLSAQVATGTQTLVIQKQAIAAAELSVEANTKSYQGGVRSAVDVLNAIQTLYQVKSDYAQQAASQAESLMALMLLIDTEPREAVVNSSNFMFHLDK